MFRLLESCRPRQWAKNVLVFAGLIFGGQLLNVSAGIRALAAFAVFCLLSSATYLVNDVIDRNADRHHPLKSRRPIAAGHVTVATALSAAAVLFSLGLVSAFCLDPLFGELGVAYVLLMALYVTILKHIVIVDAVAIAMGFALRAWGGAAAVGVPTTGWLLVMTLLLAMFLSLSKRRAELVELAQRAGAHRRTLRRYDAWWLDRGIFMVLIATIVAYTLYTIDSDTVRRFGTTYLPFTAPLPAFGLGRYMYLVYRGAGGSDPSEHLLSDGPLLWSVCLWVLAVILIIYGRRAMMA